MATYTYPQVQGGYRWNMLKRCLHEVGIEPFATGDIQEGGAMRTALSFGRDLTAEEKGKLDALMADDPANPPKQTGTHFVIKDIWERLDEFNKATGIPLELYYSESVRDSGHIDQIEMHSRRALTDEEKGKVITEFGKIITAAQ